MLTLRKTNLFEEHKKASAKLVDFAGFEMPVQYSGIIAEHNVVRTKAGIFDVSHMGEFIVSGPEKIDYLNYLVPNDLRKIEESGTALYTQLCNEQGGTIDDLIIYNRGEDFLVVVNASNIEKDWSWFNLHKNKFNIKLTNLSDQISLIAVQGPKANEILSKSIGINLNTLNSQKYFNIKQYDPFWIGRTGYTGEDGFEIFIDNREKSIELWQKLLINDAIPCGLGARDTLRLEAAYPLYGHELDEQTSPLEAGLEWSVKLTKECDFIGKNAFIKQKSEGLKKKMICLKINDKAIARQRHKVYSNNKEIGIICSGSQGITVGYPVATAYVPPSFSNIGTNLFVNIRDKMVNAIVVERPFYKRG